MYVRERPLEGHKDPQSSRILGSVDDKDSKQPSSPQQSQSTPEQTARKRPATQSPKSPRTPQRTQHVRTPASSPTLPSPMSFYQLGIGSPFRRQFPSPLARSPPSPKAPADNAVDYDDIDDEAVDDSSNDEKSSAQDDDLTQDSKDVLVERLTDLVQRLSQGGHGHLEGQDVNNLHAKVDEMERVILAGTGRSAPRAGRHNRRPLRPGGPLTKTSSDDDPDIFSGPPTRPPWLLSHFSDMSPSAAALEAQQADSAVVAQVSSEAADQLVVEAEKLCAELSAVVTSLQARREESDHIHGLLIERAELAAQRIIELEGRVEELEDEVQENESEFSHLRLQLRAVEASCLEYLPQDADQDLLQSIENWKKDWASLKKRMADRHHRPHGDGHSFSGDVTVTSLGSAGH